MSEIKVGDLVVIKDDSSDQVYKVTRIERKPRFSRDGTYKRAFAELSIGDNKWYPIHISRLEDVRKNTKVGELM